MTKTFTYEELYAMSIDELRGLVNEKNSKGRFSSNANRAMNVLRNKTVHWCSYAYEPDYDTQEQTYQGYGSYYWDYN